MGASYALLERSLEPLFTSTLQLEPFERNRVYSNNQFVNIWSTYSKANTLHHTYILSPPNAHISAFSFRNVRYITFPSLTY